MIEITEEEIAKRLQTLGYKKDDEFGTYPITWSDSDQYLIQFSIQKGLADISSNLNRDMEDFVEEMRPNIINIISSIFLASKRNIGITEDGSIVSTGQLLSIKEGTTEAHYEGTIIKSSKSELDQMIDFLKTESYISLTKYRELYNIK